MSKHILRTSIDSNNKSRYFTELSPESGNQFHEDVYEQLLYDTNELLIRVGISAKKISSVGELSRVASSMFVAVYESLFRTRLDEIIRNPQTKEEYTNNVQRVISELSDQIQIDLKHIQGKDIADGDIRAIYNLLHIFARLHTVTRSVKVFL
jgi:hypothetical protein